MDRSKALILFSLVAVAAILGSMALTVYASAQNGKRLSSEALFPLALADENSGKTMPKVCEGPRGGAMGRYGSIEVSEEFEENVINIAKSDKDVQELLNSGYNVTGVRPIIKTTVEADGDVVMKATSAVVMLRKDTTGCASVWVNVEEEKVTRIEILTRTVIEKS